MTIQYRINGALMPGSTVRYNPEAGASFPASAWYCEPMVAGVIVEDQSGSLDLTGWSTFTVEDDACSKPRIFTGWIAGKEISRGRDSNRVGTARVWNCDIVDQNALFSFEVFRSTAASVRPAETDVERIQAMIASHAMAGTPIYDNGRLSTADPRDIGGANFVKQFPAEMAVSTAGQSGKNVYAYWDESANQISIHYDAIGTGPAATISFSNVASDVNGTTVFAPLRDATLKQDPYSLYTGFLMGWVGGNTYQRNQDLIDALSPTEFSPINFLRDQVYETSRIGESSTAATYTARYLEENGVEKATLTFSALLPASVVNLAHAGDVISVRFSHLPGLTTATDVAIIRRSVTPVDGHDSLYEVGFECATFAEHGPGGGGSFPFGGTCDADSVDIVQKVRYSLSSTSGNPGIDVHGASWTNNGTPGGTPTPPTPGNLLVCMWALAGNQAGDTGDMDGWTPIVTSGVSMVGAGGHGGLLTAYWKIAEASEPLTPTATGAVINASNLDDNQNYLYEIAGVDSLDTFATGFSDSPTDHPGLSITPTADLVAFLLTIQIWSSALDGPGAPDPGVTEDFEEGNISDGGNPVRWLGHQIVADTTGSYNVRPTTTGNVKWANITMAFSCSGSQIPPASGQPVVGETPGGTVDGSNNDFTTEFPTVQGLIHFLHDGIDQTNHVTTFDEATQTFTLDYAPSAGSTLRIDYEGHP